MPHSLYVTLLYILSYRNINFKLAFKFSTDHALPTAEAAHSQDLRSPGMSLHLYVRPPSIPGKHQSCDWPSKLPHPSPSWTRQWIQYVPRKGARSWIGGILGSSQSQSKLQLPTASQSLFPEAWRRMVSNLKRRVGWFTIASSLLNRLQNDVTRFGEPFSRELGKLMSMKSW